MPKKLFMALLTSLFLVVNSSYLVFAAYDMTTPMSVGIKVDACYTTTISLEWMALGYNAQGQASSYDVRYMKNTPITESNWAGATQVTDEPAPQPATYMERIVVRGLTPNTTYYFAVKVGGTTNNWSNLSNSVVGVTKTVPTVDNPPSVYIGQWSATMHESQTIIAGAGDDAGIKSVEFYVDNVLKYTTTVPFKLYYWSWDITNYSNGTHTLKVVATDTANQTGYAQKVVTVDKVVSDPPGVSITEPSNNSAVGGIVTISGTASDNKGISSVRFEYRKVGNSEWNEIASDNSYPYSIQWDMSGLEQGSQYNLRTISIGESGVENNSTGYITVTINNTIPSVPPSGDTTAPAAIKDLSVEMLQGKLSDVSDNWKAKLVWTAVGDDGTTGTAKIYDIRYLKDTPISEYNWASATQVTGEPIPQIAGSAETITINDLGGHAKYYFAIKTTDEASNQSNLSNVAKSIVPWITGLEDVGQEVDGIHKFDFLFDTEDTIGLKKLQIYIDDSLVKTMNKVDGVLHKFGGEGDYLHITGAGDVYCWQSWNWDTTKYSNGKHSLKAIFTDDLNKTYILQSSATVNNLLISNVTSNSVKLSWLAFIGSHHGGYNINKIGSYDVRYMIDTPINNFDSATQVSGEPVPQQFGGVETFTVNGLKPNTKYHFAIKIIPIGYAPSGFHTANFVTLLETPEETNTPGTINSLTVQMLQGVLKGVSDDWKAKLDWTATGDDGTTGTATSYDIRYMKNTPITESNWASATQVTGEPIPQIAGSVETITINDLDGQATYYFAIKAIDESSNQSNISNVAFGNAPWITVMPRDGMEISGKGRDGGNVGVYAGTVYTVGLKKLEIYIDGSLAKTMNKVDGVLHKFGGEGDYLHITGAGDVYCWQSWNWDTTQYADGIHTLKIAFTDDSDKVLYLETTVKVKNSVKPPEPKIVDNPPEIKIQSPVNGEQNVKGTKAIMCHVTDDNGIAKLDFYVDNVLKTTLTKAKGLSIIGNGTVKKEQKWDDWDTTHYVNGDHNIKVVVTDTSGQTAKDECTVTTFNDNIVLSTAVAMGVGITADIHPMETILNPCKGGKSRIIYIIGDKAAKGGSVHVTIEIFNANGDLIKTLVDEDMCAGTHQSVWEGESFDNEVAASGVYIARLRAGKYTASKKMVVIK